jgi:GDP-L-fucose synthase
MARLHDAKRDRLPEVTIWGTGKPLREFLYVDDLADGLILVCQARPVSESVEVSYD